MTEVDAPTRPSTASGDGRVSPLTFRERCTLGLLGALSRLPGNDSVTVGRYLDRLCRASVDRLRELEAGMAPTLAKTEQEFLAFGQSLARLSLACDQIVNKGQRLVALATGTEAGEESVTGTLEILERPFAYIASFSQDSSGIALQSKAAELAAQRILAAEVRLKRAVQPLVYLRTLFQIGDPSDGSTADLCSAQYRNPFA